MKPKRIILIRHGESLGNIDKTIYNSIPDYAIDLSDKGLEQAREAGKALKEIVKNETMFAYVSPMWRTRSTFEQIAKSFSKSQIEYREEPRIREQEWGHIRSIEESELVEGDRDAYGTFYFRIPDGESAADVYDRVSDFLGTLNRDFEKEHYPENAVIVTHGMAIRLFIMRWFHLTVEEFESLANPKNCQIFILEKQPNNKYVLKSELRKHEVYHSFQRPLNIE